MVRRAPISVQLVICVLSVYTKGDSESSCSRILETIPHARMCTDDVINSEFILVITRDAYTTGHVTCTCTASLSSPRNISVERFSNEVSSANGSCDDISLKSRGNGTSAILPCQNNTTVEIELSTSRVLDIVWNYTSANTNNTSCVLLNSTATFPIDAILTLTCVSQQQTTTSGLPQCISGEVRDIDQTVPTAQTEIELRCTSVETLILITVIGYLLAAIVVVGTIIYYRRKIAQLEKTIGDSSNRAVSTCTDISNINTEWTDASSARTGSAYVHRAGSSSRPPEFQTGTIYEYDEIDLAPKRDSSMYLEPVKAIK